MERMTNQRIKILDYLKSVKSHPNAEEVYRNVKKDMPSISLATVYRNLNNLVKEGKATRIEANGESHFDADMKCHQHFVCRSCGKIDDICIREISDHAIRKASGTSFSPDSVVIIFWGICRRCKNDKKKAGKRAKL